MRVAGGTLKGFRLQAPRGQGTRPTSQRLKGAIFNRLAILGLEGAVVLDIYAGIGALGIEALSRGARHADFVEADTRLCSLIRQNLKMVRMENRATVIHSTVERALPRLSRRYDIVLMDPPYAQGFPHPILERLAQSLILGTGATVVVEHSSREVPGPGYGSLRLVDDRRHGDSAIAFYNKDETS